MPHWEPRPSDKIWLFYLVNSLKVGGQWIAPMGFTFKKVGPRKLVVTDFDRNNPDVVETIERTRKVGDAIGVEIDLGT